MKKILFIFGTRPEAIKMAPLVKVYLNRADLYNTKVCVTGQHREMLDQVLEFFEIIPDYDLKLMKHNQTLFDVTADGLKGLQGVLADFDPDLLYVQGDTTTAFIGALAGFYTKCKVAHVEAGLRSGNKMSPWPEEINRTLAGHIADIHYAPTEKAMKNLKGEGIKTPIKIVGNTVIDALFLGLKLIETKGNEKYNEYFSFADFNKRIILVTGHRRESFGEPFENMCHAMKHIIEKYDDVEIIYPVHLNPNVREPVNRILGDTERIHLIEPLSYPYLIYLMNKSYFVLTDSGGIQEEAPSLGKPVLVMREVTERVEGVEAGTAMLVGTDKEKIINEAEKLLSDNDHYISMSKAVNPYGDGTAAEQIIEHMNEYFG